MTAKRTKKYEPITMKNTPATTTLRLHYDDEQKIRGCLREHTDIRDRIIHLENQIGSKSPQRGPTNEQVLRTVLAENLELRQSIKALGARLAPIEAVFEYYFRATLAKAQTLPSAAESANPNPSRLQDLADKL